MDPNHLTQKSQEALHDAQTKALRFGHTEVDVEHLLLALLDQSEGIVPRLLSQAGADPDRLRPRWRRSWAGGPGSAARERTRGRSTSPSGWPASWTPPSRRRALKDEYVSVEHLVLAMLAEGQATVGRLPARAGG